PPSKTKKLDEDQLSVLCSFQEYVRGICTLVDEKGPASFDDRLAFLLNAYALSSPDKVGRLELARLVKQHTRAPDPAALYLWVKKHFASADQDRDGWLSFHDANSLLKSNPEISGHIRIDL
ncbi:unnamed protein product, partial [Phaeothamnion confervicola]